jgi:hypothetical protein
VLIITLPHVKCADINDPNEPRCSRRRIFDLKNGALTSFRAQGFRHVEVLARIVYFARLRSLALLNSENTPASQRRRAHAHVRALARQSRSVSRHKTHARAHATLASPCLIISYIYVCACGRCFAQDSATCSSRPVARSRDRQSPVGFGNRTSPLDAAADVDEDGGDMLRLALRFRPLRPGGGTGGGGVTTVGSGSGNGRSVRRELAALCRRVWNEGVSARCCPAGGGSLRDRLKLYRVRRTACQTGCTRAFLVVLNFAFLVSVPSQFYAPCASLVRDGKT